MKYDEYKDIYNQLRTPEDVERLSSTYDARMLDSLFTQKTTREVKKRYVALLDGVPDRPARTSGPT